MAGLVRYLGSTLGQKQLIGLAGLGLSFFVLMHMAGNLLIFISPQVYNEYGHAIVTNQLIYVAELGLLLIFILHILTATALSIWNRVSRPEGYKKSAKGAKRTSLVAKTLIHQGIIILVFVVLHLITFKFGSYYEVSYGSGVIRDLHRLMVEVFQQPIYVVWYVFCLLILGLHLSHGFASSVQTLGFNHPAYTPTIKIFSRLYAWVVTVGFLSQPIYIYFFYEG